MAAKVIAFRLGFNVKTGEGAVALKLADRDEPVKLEKLSAERFTAVCAVLRSDANVSADPPWIVCGDEV